MAPLDRRFFARPTLVVARALLGMVVSHRVGTSVLSGRIVEVEAYTDDAASHARGARRTPRNAIMFGPAGYAYVYFTYGMHYCLNIVTGREGRPGAVLIRGLDEVRATPVTDTHLAANGPARLCRALGISLAQNGLDLTTGERLWLTAGRRVRSERVIRATRIGIRVAEELPWRFYLFGSDGVSRRDRSAEASLVTSRRQATSKATREGRRAIRSGSSNGQSRR